MQSSMVPPPHQDNRQQHGHGRLIVVSAPSGAGKTTLCQAVLDRFHDLVYSVSHTTRNPRVNERDGIDYHFISQEQFENGIRDRMWAEWAEVHGNYYGTSAAFIDTHIAKGRNVLLDIDVQGTTQILERYPDSVTIFSMPPSLDTLRQRLESRGTESPNAIARRLNAARNEMRHSDLYRHVLVNDRLPDTIEALCDLIFQYH